MASGKKREKGKKVKIQTVDMSQNPLYAEKQESPVKESLIAVGTAFVAVVLFALIVSNFSGYSSSGNVSYTADSGYSTPQADEAYIADEPSDDTAMPDSGQSTEDPYIADQPSDDTVMPDSGQSADAVMSQFGISADTVADYANVLDPAQYGHYDSGIAGFSFSYPAGLYNSVTVDEAAHPDRYGANIQNIYFAGSDGSELIFSVSQRTDGQSVEQETAVISDMEKNGIVEVEEILNTVKDGYGKIVMTGWTDDTYARTVYQLIKVEQDHVLQMKVITPNYLGNEDEFRKGYVTECLYRMCGFSDSTAGWRSYSEYTEEADG